MYVCTTANEALIVGTSRRKLVYSLTFRVRVGADIVRTTICKCGPSGTIAANPLGLTLSRSNCLLDDLSRETSPASFYRWIFNSTLSLISFNPSDSWIRSFANPVKTTFEYIRESYESYYIFRYANIWWGPLLSHEILTMDWFLNEFATDFSLTYLMTSHCL